MKKFFKIGIIIIIVISLFILTGCRDDSVELLNKKIDSEMDYIENEIFRIVKKYMSNQYLSENKELDWGLIKEDLSSLNESYSVLITDFIQKGFEKGDVLRFEEGLNNVNLRLEEKNDIQFLLALSDLYSLIPECEYKYFGYNSEVSIRTIANYNLYSIISCMQGDFDKANQFCLDAEQEYINLTKDTEYLKDNSYYVNRIYVVLQEYKISLNENNIELAIIKYLNTLGI